MSSSEIRVDTIKSRTGLGTVTINSSGLQLSGIITSENRVDVKSYDGTPGRLDLYCESSNAHYARIQAPDHADFSGNVTLTLPNTAGTLLNSDVSGNVGIGTATANWKLDVESDETYIASFVQSSTSSAQQGILVESDQGRGDLGTWNAIKINGNDNVSYDSRITWAFDSIAEGPAIGGRRTTTSGTDLIFYTTTSESLTEKLRINSSGNVGIGTDNPTEKLHVLGDARITGILTVGTASLTIDGDAGTINGIPYATAGSLSNRNLIDNGGMRVAQRGTSFTGVTDQTTLDRWYFFDGTSAVFDVAQSSTAPNGFSNSLKVDCTTTGTPTTTQEIYAEHRIEAQNLQHLQYGASGAQSTTLSFWVKSNKTADYGLWLYLQDTGVNYATTYTISAADTWEYKTIQIPGNTANAINNDNGLGLLIRFYLGIGPTNAGTPTETWSADATNRSPDTNLGDSTSNEWLLSGVQLEVGTQATPFEHRSFGDELKRCERYYEKSYTYVSSPGTTTFNGALTHRKSGALSSYTDFNIRFQTRKRATPTIGLYSPSSATEGQIESDSVNVTANDGNTNEQGFSVTTSAAQAADVVQSMHYTADAEL
jgi:hypothetical protein